MEEKEVNNTNPEELELGAPEPAKLEEELARIIKERDEYLSGWQRAKADFINYKKEELRRLQDVARSSSEDVIRDLIPVVDSFELGLAALEKSGHVEKGVYMIKGQLEDMLRRKGVERIKVELGTEFDPNYQEAVAVVDSLDLSKDKEWKSGTVAEEVEAGYFYQGKLLRPTRVRLVK